jgi:hypothetical protein
MENIIIFTVQKDENRVIIHLEADKERFKSTLSPLLETILHVGAATVTTVKMPEPKERAPEQ